MVGWHHQLNGHELSKLWEILKDREVWQAAVNGVTKLDTTQQLKNNNKCIIVYRSLKKNMYNRIVQFSSVAQSCPTLCDPMDCSMPGFRVHHQLLERTQLMSIELVMPSNHLILYHPLLIPSSSPPRDVVEIFWYFEIFWQLLYLGTSVAGRASQVALPVKNRAARLQGSQPY